MTDLWDPARYERFKAERSQPFYDLLQLVEPRPGLRVIDLGCGTGELTRELHRRLRASSTTGLERSQAMLSRARAFVEQGLTFQAGDLSAWHPPGNYDLVFSNAALQWVPEQEAVLARWTRALAPGGQLAIQVPANFDHRAHAAAAEVASEEPFRGALEGYVRGDPGLRPEDYSRLLYQLGYERQQVRLQVYAHLLPCREALYEWMRGTLLLAYLEGLPEELQPPFLERYRRRLRAACPDERPFFFPFKRILMWARQPGKLATTL